MILGLVVALIAIFCVEEESGNRDGKEYLILNDELGEENSDSESSSKVQVLSSRFVNSDNQRTFVID